MPGKTNFTCYEENISRNHEKTKTVTNSIKENKIENAERKSDTAVANTAYRSYAEATKNGLKEK